MVFGEAPSNSAWGGRGCVEGGVECVELVKLVFILVINSDLAFTRGGSGEGSIGGPLIRVISVIASRGNDPLGGISVVYKRNTIILCASTGKHFRAGIRGSTAIVIRTLKCRSGICGLSNDGVIPRGVILGGRPLFLARRSLIGETSNNGACGKGRMNTADMLRGKRFKAFPSLALAGVLRNGVLNLRIHSAIDKLKGGAPSLFVHNRRNVSRGATVIVVSNIRHPTTSLVPRRVRHVRLLGSTATGVLCKTHTTGKML